MIAEAHRLLQRTLEAVVIFLLGTMALIVIVAVIYRKAGASLVWYDEVASIVLTWVTYYGAALVALKRGHIGVNDVINRVRPPLRLWLVAVSEACVFGFFILLAWMGWRVLEVLEGTMMVSLPDVPVLWAQSVIPVGAVLFIIAQALSLPKVWKQAKSPAGLVSHAAADEALT